MSAEVIEPKYPIQDEIEVPENVLANWQVTANLLAEIAEAGVQIPFKILDSRFRGNDK